VALANADELLIDEDAELELEDQKVLGIAPIPNIAFPKQASTPKKKKVKIAPRKRKKKTKKRKKAH
jgi:hypothetical protein